jgi:histone chaperone ASF1
VSKIPKKDILGITALLLTCSYNNQEFFRVGYYLNNTYEDEEMNNNPPEEVQIDKLIRNILADKPRITKFNIDWDSTDNVVPTYSNYMFNDKKENENIKDEFKKKDKDVQNLFLNINNNKN